jgi:hypothetical protein
VQDLFEIDSAGTHAYHIGEQPDSRSQVAAHQYNVDLSSQRARQVHESAGLRLGLKNHQVGEKWVSDDCSYLCKGLHYIN